MFLYYSPSMVSTAALRLFSFLWASATLAAAQPGCTPLSQAALNTEILTTIPRPPEGATQTVASFYYNCLAYAPPDLTKLRSFVVSANVTVSPRDGATSSVYYRLYFSCSANSFGGVDTALPFSETNATSTYCADCNSTSVDQPCTPCSVNCTKDRCYGANATQCCNYFQEDNCVETCSGHYASNGTEDSCVCAENFSGKNCSVCDLVCENGGTANVETCTECLCASNYVGPKCERFNYCALTPCKNNGTCVNGVSNFTCKCTGNWIGLACEVFDHCALTPCENNGTCINGVSNFTCTCTENWMGSTCKVLNHCASNPCKNNGTCANRDSDFTCTCTENWKGSTCSECNRKCESSHWKPDKTCAECACSGNWTGSNCMGCDLRVTNDTCTSPCPIRDYLPDKENVCYACGLSYCETCDLTKKACKTCTNGRTEEDGVCIETKNHTGTIIGVVIGIICAVLLIMIAGYCWNRHQKRKGYNRTV